MKLLEKHRQKAETFLRVCHKMSQLMYVTGHGGNAAWKLEDDLMLITPTQMNKGDIQLEDLVFLDLDGIKVEGTKRPPARPPCTSTSSAAAPTSSPCCIAIPPIPASSPSPRGPTCSCAPSIPRPPPRWARCRLCPTGSPSPSAWRDNFNPLLPKYNAFLMENHGLVIDEPLGHPMVYDDHRAPGDDLEEPYGRGAARPGEGYLRADLKNLDNIMSKRGLPMFGAPGVNSSLVDLYYPEAAPPPPAAPRAAVRPRQRERPDMAWLRLEGKVAVVTGGGSGIGRACCEALAENGAKVVVADRDKTAGTETVERLKQERNVAALFHETDVTRSQDAAALMAAAVSAFGGIDILVNNAGINIPRLLVDPAGKEELGDDVLQRMMGVNLHGVIYCAREAARRMLSARRSGVIINMTSESGLEGSEGQSAYSATKAALHGLTRSWAKELGRHGVRVVGVAPGILEATGLRSDAYEKSLAYTRGITVEALQQGYVKHHHPPGRAGRLSEVADLVAFLASERASYVHGTVINISGGKTRG